VPPGCRRTVTVPVATASASVAEPSAPGVPIASTVGRSVLVQRRFRSTNRILRGRGRNELVFLKVSSSNKRKDAIICDTCGRAVRAVNAILQLSLAQAGKKTIGRSRKGRQIPPLNREKRRWARARARDTAKVAAACQPHVALLAPARAPRITDDPVVWRVPENAAVSAQW
jgi:hypothetical protein